MLRPFLTTGFIALAGAGFADTFIGDADVDAVTIYPGLAVVTRQVTLDLPAGRHEIIVPQLPMGLATEGLRIAAPTGARVGAVNVSSGRLPVTPDQASDEIIAARAEVARLEAVLRERTDEIAMIRLRAQAAEDQIAFLQSLSERSAGGALSDISITAIQDLAQMVGAETLALRQAAFAAEQEAQAASLAREKDVENLDAARQALAALIAPEKDGSVLTFTLNAAVAGAVTVDISTLEGFANWVPVYDMRLTTGDAPGLSIDRAVVISQASGQDWNDVKLTLSTARPGESIAPGEVFPPLRRIIDADKFLPEPRLMMSQDDQAVARAGGNGAPEMVMEAPMPVTAQADFSGAAVTYFYPGRVDIRDGVDDLRLPLDTVDVTAEVWAEAVPSRDRVAYRMAGFTNTTDEILLPGQALMFADGDMIGFGRLPVLAAGADVEMGFGPLDGLRLSRLTPRKTEGDVGVFSSSNQLTEQAILKIENLTGQDWAVLLRDVVPYSEQDDLEVAFTAKPDVSRIDAEGRRGVLEWDLDVPSGATRDITLDYTLTWPSGFILR